MRPYSPTRKSLAIAHGTTRFDQRDGAGIDEPLEQAVLDQPDQRLGAEDADGQVHAVEHEREDRQAGQRLADEPPEAFLDARGRARGGDAGAGRPGRAPRGRGRRGGPHRTSGTAARPMRLAQFGEAAAFGGHRLDHRNAQPRRQPRGVDRRCRAPAPRRPCSARAPSACRIAASCEVSISPRRRFLASATWMTTSVSPASRMRRATSSSSLSAPFERRDAGRVDEVAHLAARPSTRPCVSDTVVPGIVRDDGVLPGQAAEEDALADVGVADERDAARAGAKGQDRGGRRFTNRSLGAGHPGPRRPAHDERGSSWPIAHNEIQSQHSSS